MVNTGRIIDAEDEFYVHLTKPVGPVILAGTPLPPYTPNLTLPAYGPGTPVPTFVTNPTNQWMVTPSLETNITTTPFAPLIATSTPTTQPYPPPSSPTPSPTLHSYP